MCLSAQCLVPNQLSPGISFNNSYSRKGSCEEGLRAMQPTQLPGKLRSLAAASRSLSPGRRAPLRRTKDRAWNSLPSAQHREAPNQPPLFSHSSKDLIYVFLNKGNLISGTGSKIRPQIGNLVLNLNYYHWNP